MNIETINKCSIRVTKPRNILKDIKGGRSKYEIENIEKNHSYEIDIERCVYQNLENDTKCDYGIQTEKTFYLIELKGSDVKKGIEQPLSTLKVFKNCCQNTAFKARLIVSKFSSPDIVRKTKEYKDLVKLLKHIENKNDKLIIKQNIFTEII